MYRSALLKMYQNQNVDIVSTILRLQVYHEPIFHETSTLQNVVHRWVYPKNMYLNHFLLNTICMTNNNKDTSVKCRGLV